MPTTLILDASTLINLVATARFAEIAGAGLYRFAVAEYVLNEEALFIWQQGPEDAEPQRVPLDLGRFVDDGLLEVLRLDTSDEVATFVNFAITIDDGEAITAALACHRGCALATDDRKARRVIAEGAPTLQLVSTLDLLHGWAELGQVPEDELLQRVMEAIRSWASYVPGPRNPRFEWWQDIMQRRG